MILKCIHGGLDLVVRLKLSEVQIGAFLKVGTATASAATVNSDADKALTAQICLIGAACPVGTCPPGVLHRLRTRTRVLMHYDGVLLGGVKVGWFHHPAIKLDAISGLERKHFLYRHIILRYTFTQFGIVDEGLEHFAGVVAQGGDLWSGHVGIYVDEVFHRGAERCGVAAQLCRQLAGLAFQVGGKDGSARSVAVLGTVVECLSLGLVAVEIAHLTRLVGNLPEHLACGRIPVELALSRPVAL